LEHYIYTTYIEQSVPKFVYFNDYYQMNGVENILAMQQRVAENKPKPSDHPMLGLIELARLDLGELVQIKRTQDLVNQLEGAGNHLTKSVLKYWSQNKHITTRFDIRPGLAEDPEELRNENNIYANIYDSRHMVSTSIGTRSRGFVWFFSFLAWYSKLKKDAKPLILLLDEPGLSLHAKAQEDLLCYFEKEVKGVHQIIYTTHSPFMVDSTHFKRVRIVQDKGIDTLDPLPPEEEGTKVLTEVLKASSDSLFPLQGALGYEIYQTLFIGPNSLIVEGASDLQFLQTVSLILERKGRTGLNPKWVITPVGGASKVPTFVALIGAQKNMNLVTFIDIQKKDKQSIDNFYKRKLLKKNHIITFGDFINTDEADIEDMFERSFLLKIINLEYKNVLNKPIEEAELERGVPRINICLEKYFTKNPMKKSTKYSHYRIARYFAENVTELGNSISNKTLDRFEKAFSLINSLLKK
jgi:energy-coupling factor transporter ATP-binding protein EcfA2